MKSTSLLIALAVTLCLTAFSFIEKETVPEGWFKAGSQPEKYEMGIEKGAGKDGKNAAMIKSIAPKISGFGFGTLMQDCKPDIYKGKRIRMSGYMKSKEVKGWAGFWLRIDDNLEFDNMANRPVKGTTDWTRYEVILNVPTNATNIAYGALLSGTGQIWFDDMNFEVVGDAVTVTGEAAKKSLSHNEPTNLDFEK